MRHYVSPLNGPGNSASLSARTCIGGNNISTGQASSSSNSNSLSHHSRTDERCSLNRPARRNGLEIPLDVLFLIFMECDARSLITSRLVCRHFDGFITTQKPLLYKLALYFERQVDYYRPHINCQLAQASLDTSSSTQTVPVPTTISAPTTITNVTSSITGSHASSYLSPLSSHQKLQRLRRQSLAWRGALSPGLKTSIPVTRSDSIYELNGGIFALGDVSPMDGWVIGPNGELNSTRGVSLDFVRLPSLIAGVADVEWTHINIGEKISIVDFTMDVEQDLLVVIEQKFSFVGDQRQPAPYRLHLLSLSLSTETLTQHPLADFPVVEYPCHPDWWEYQLVLNIYGDHLGLLFSSGRAASCEYDRVVVWDWKTGQLSAMHAGDDVYESFVLLGEGNLLLPSMTTASLDIYHYTFSERDLSHDLRRSPLLLGPSGSPTPGSMTCIMKFMLPAVHPGLGYGYILARSQPTGQPTSSKNSPSTHFDSSSSLPHPTFPLNKEETDEQSNSNPNVFAHYHPPFAPSIDDSIIVISVHVGRISEDANPNDPNADPNASAERELKDSDGTLIVKKSTLRKWLVKEEDKRSHLERAKNRESNSRKSDKTGFNQNPGDVMTGVEEERVVVDSSHVSQSVQTVPEITLGEIFATGQLSLSNSASLLRDRMMASTSSSLFSPSSSLSSSLLTQAREYSVQQLSRIPQHDQASWITQTSASNGSPLIPAPSPVQLPTPAIVPWQEWMHQSRWLRGMGSPRWVRDVHGTRVATRVAERPRDPTPIPAPVIVMNPTNAINLTIHTNNQQTPSVHSPPNASAQPQIQTTVQAQTSQAQTQVQAHLQPQHHAQAQAQAIPQLQIPIPIQGPGPGQGQSQVQIAGNGMVFFQPPSSETHAKTRIYDFNNLPSIRAPETIPYPKHLKLDLRPEISVSNPTPSAGTSNSTGGKAGTSTSTVYSHTNSHIRARAMSSAEIERGWSIVRPEDGQEWIRRPVWDDTVISPGITFAEEICTGLPYLEITSTSWTECTGLMIDAERIIGMKTDEHGNLVSLEVLTM